MQLTEFERNITLAKKLAVIMNWDFGKIRIEVGNSEIRFYENPFISSSSITICKKASIKNKLLRVKLYNNIENEDLFIYRKKPENTCNQPKQSPSKDRLFNLSLQHDIVTNYDELVQMEKVMDEYDDVIQIAIQLNVRRKYDI